MDDNEINSLLDKKILGAKLEVAEKRFNFLIILFGAFLTIFGIIVPLWLTNTSSNEVDKAVEDMKTELKYQVSNYDKNLVGFDEKFDKYLREFASSQSNYINSSSSKINEELQSLENRFKELAGNQLRKPNVICLLNGKSIENIFFTFNKSKSEYVLELRNIGDAPAKNTFMKLYLKTEKNISVYDYFQDQYFSDEENYNRSYSFSPGTISIDPKDSYPFRLNIMTEEIKESVIIPALLKIYFEQPDPVKYNFSIKLDYN